MHETELPTPFVMVDESVMMRNINGLSAYANQHRLNVAPHTKTHKSIYLARLQLQAGASSLTIAKAGEAEVMSELGCELFLAYPTIDPARCAVIAELACKQRVRVAVDSIMAVDSLQQAAGEAKVGVMVDLDIGMHRTGVPTPQKALEIAKRIDGAKSLDVAGLFYYPGHIWAGVDQQPPLLRQIDEMLAETIDLWSKSGIECRIVSGGSTPTLYQSHLITRTTEIRPGTYIFNDMNTVRGGFCDISDCAAHIVCTVVSDAVAGKVVVDAGTKTLTSDRNAPRPDSGHGHLIGHPEALITRLSEEHGEIDITHCEKPPKLGQRVAIVPNHICPCINLQDKIWLKTSDGDIQAISVDARGRLS